MKALTLFLRQPIGAGNTGALFLRCAQVLMFLVAAFVLVAGLLKVCRLELAEAQLFGAVQQVVQTTILFCIFGLLLPTRAGSAQKNQKSGTPHP